MERKLILLLIISFCVKIAFAQVDNKDSSTIKGNEILNWGKFRHYVNDFNRNDEELYVQLFPNDEAEDFLSNNIPYFECSDKEIEKIYYYRWWTYRKHLKQTPEGFIITEFLPTVPWAGKYNGISCPAIHHFNEGRWLHNQKYLESYAWYWLKGGEALGVIVFRLPKPCLIFIW